MTIRWEVTVRRALGQLVGGLLIILLIALITVSTMQIVWRYLLQHSLSWSEELARFMFVWVVTLGAAVAFNSGSHITIDLFIKWLPRVPRIATQWAGRLVMMGIWLIVAVTTLQLLPIVNLQRSPALGLPMGWAYLAVLVGTLLTLAFLFLDAIEEVRNRKELPIEEEQGKEII
jgi:TRAP-type transport system small permease protein